MSITVSATTPSVITPAVTDATITATAVNGSVVSVTASETSAAITVSVSGSTTVTATSGSTVAVAVGTPSTLSVSVLEVSGIQDAPIDGTLYGRKDGAWSVAGTGGVTAHSDLSELDYASAGHTGFQPAGSYLTVETDPVFLASEAADFAVGDAAKLAGIEAGAEVNNISDINATDLTDGGSTTLHTHAAPAGMGDVVGPAVAVDSNFAAFNTTTGKLIKDSGSKAGDFSAAVHTHSYEPIDATIVRTGQTNWIDLTDSGMTTLHSHSPDHAAVTLDANADTLLSLSTQALGLDTQAANTVLAGRVDAGTALVPTFRALVSADIPALSYEPVISILSPAKGGTGVNNGSFNLTVPATGTAALLGTANVFTVGGQMVDSAADAIELRLQAHSTKTTNILTIEKSDATVVAGVDSKGRVFSYGFAGVTSNLFLGTSGNATLTGTDNVAIGNQALLALTSGVGNFALGFQALWSNQSGNANVAIGSYSMYSIAPSDTRGNNIAIGSSAGYFNVTGRGNVYIGNSAGFGVTGQSNDYNTFIGEFSGRGITYGQQNVCIGRSSGEKITTGNYNIYVGMYAGYNQTSGSNKLIIDDTSRASAAVELTNAIIYGVMGATPSVQTLALNAVTKIAVNTTTNNAPLVLFDLNAYVSTASTGFANGGGVGMTWTGETATDGTSQLMAQIAAVYVDSTNATRKAKLQLSAYDTAARLGLEIEASGTVAKLGFFGVATVVRPTALTAQLTTITATAPGTPDYAIQDMVAGGYGFVTADEAQSTLKVILNLQTRVSELETKLQGLGLLT